METLWPEQPDLFGPPPVRDPGWDDKLYFALLPDAHAKVELLSLAAQLVDRHRLVGRANADTLHVSVLGIGLCRELSPEHVAIAEAAAAALTCRPFALTFTSVMSYEKTRKGSRYPLALRCGDGADGVDHLARALHDAMAERGFTPAGKLGAQPHLTLLYDARVLEPAPLVRPVTIDVSAVALVRNHNGQSRHEAKLFPFRR